MKPLQLQREKHELLGVGSGGVSRRTRAERDRRERRGQPVGRTRTEVMKLYVCWGTFPAPWPSRRLSASGASAPAMRCDSTVVEADVRYPSDAALAVAATRAPGREGRRLAGMLDGGAKAVRDRSRAAGRRLRLIGRTMSRRAGEKKAAVLRVTGEAGELVGRSVREARRLAGQARATARGRGAQAKLAAARRLDELADRAEKVARQIEQRLAGEKISDRLVSLADPDARPIRKGKLGKPTEFGYVFQLAELTANTRRGARGFLLPPASRIGSPNETELLPTTAAELDRLGIRPREVALDGGLSRPRATPSCRPPARSSSPAASNPNRDERNGGSPATESAAKGRISHLKRGYGLRRARLKGHDGARTWVGWAVLTYNLDTIAVQSA